MVGINVLNAASRSNLFAIQKTQSNITQITERLSTGRKVNSTLDNPQNYAASRALLQRSSGLSNVLDNIVRSVLTLQAATNGLDSISDLFSQATSALNESKESLLAGTSDSNSSVVVTDTIQDIILADSPVAYFRLDGNADNTGTGGTALNGVLANGGPDFAGVTIYSNDPGSSAQFNGNEGIRVPDSSLINVGTNAERTVELVFNADDVTTRQVLYEEGGSVNSLAIYIDNGEVYATGRDSGTGGPFSVSAPINADETYHFAFTFDFPGTASFTGYLNGENIGSTAVGRDFPSHAGDIGIGYSPDGNWYFDTASSARNYFQGRITDVAIYNTTLSEDDFQQRSDALAAEFINDIYTELVNQIDQLAADSDYLGTNLLNGDLLTTGLNVNRTSVLTTTGANINQNNFSLLSGNFSTTNDLDDILGSVQSALATVERFANSLANDLGILNTRSDFTQDTINTLNAGSDDLTLADLDEEGANLIAATTQLLIAQETLSSASALNTNIFSALSSGNSSLSFFV